MVLCGSLIPVMFPGAETGIIAVRQGLSEAISPALLRIIHAVVHIWGAEGVQMLGEWAQEVPGS